MFEALVILIILVATGILFVPFFRDNGFRIYADEQQFIPKVAALLGSREHMLTRLADLQGDMESGKLSPEDFHESRAETVASLKKIDAQLAQLEQAQPLSPNLGVNKDQRALGQRARSASLQTAPPASDSTGSLQRARFCSACGYALKETFRFCPSCGEKVEI